MMDTRVKVKPSNYVKGHFDIVDSTGLVIGRWKTPKQARHKARMWHMWLTTGDKRYLRKEQVGNY